jgi:GNAT superfamily N-acetyltransferase
LRRGTPYEERDGVSELVIRRLDAASDADMDGFQGVYAAAELAEDPHAALYSRADGVAMLTTGDSTSLFDAFGAFLGDRMVAETILLGSLRDNLALGQILLWVHPAHRGQGVGTVALAELEQHAGSRGRRILRVQLRMGKGLDGNRRFAERHGYVLEMTEIERRLSLPADPELLGRLEAEAAPHHAAYEIRSFAGRVPDELRASYVEVNNLLAVEAPHGDLELEPARNTVADLDRLDQEREASGRTSATAVALYDGRVVGYANASVPGTAGLRHVDQYGTLVHPDHRGHRLGMAVKCAQLRLLAEHFPDRAYIQTSNAEVNAHMVAINVALGFEVHQVWGEFEKRLDP